MEKKINVIVVLNKIRPANEKLIKIKIFHFNFSFKIPAANLLKKQASLYKNNKL
jgi:hypothetical protein